jgi:hypothetical protein
MIACRPRVERRRRRAKLLQMFEAIGSRTLGLGDAAAAVDRAVRCLVAWDSRITIFPLTGAILYPGLHLPLHIFEPRYRAMISDALARDRRIGMIQPQRESRARRCSRSAASAASAMSQALDDGRFNIVLEGEARFALLR